jgi:hypothetical protein
VGSLPTTAEKLLNIEIQKNGSIRLRPAFTSLSSVNILDDESKDYSDINSGAFPSYAGSAFHVKERQFAGVIKNQYNSISQGKKQDLLDVLLTTEVPPVGGAALPVAGTSPYFIHAKGRILSDNDWRAFFNVHSLILLGKVIWSGSTGTFGIHIRVRDSAGTVVTLNQINHQHFRTGTFFGKRLWLANHTDTPNTVYISQVINDFSADGSSFGDPGNMFAVDPANIVATDGGTITVSDANRILALTPYLNGVAVLADNGIWLISGPDGIFSATAFNVTRLSSIGIVGEDSWTVYNNKLIFASDHDVNALTYSADGAMSVQSISVGKINSRLEKISKFHKQTSGMLYNTQTNSIWWFVNDDELYGSDAGDMLAYEKSRNPVGQFLHCVHAFVYDLDLNAWYQWSMPHTVGPHWGVTGYYTLRGNIGDQVPVTVNGVDVTVSSVLVTADDINQFPEQLHTILVLQREMSDDNQPEYRAVTLAHLTGHTDFDAVDIDAEVLSHPFTFDNLSNKKKLHFLDTAMTRVESGVVNTSTGEDINPGSLLATFGWDWFTPGASTHPKANFTSQLYHPHRWLQSLNDGGDPKKTVVHEKHKIRGRGTAVQVKLTNPDGKDFHLNGWQITVAGSRRR